MEDNNDKNTRYLRSKAFLCFVIAIGSALGCTSISYYYKDNVMVMLWSLLILHMAELAAIFYLHILARSERNTHEKNLTLTTIILVIALIFLAFLLILEVMTWFMPTAAMFPKI